MWTSRALAGTCERRRKPLPCPVQASQPGEGPTNDDLTPETLILEDGAHSRHEPQQGNLEPADKTLSIVRDDEIGVGNGLDEAELARREPLNRGKTAQKK